LTSGNTCIYAAQYTSLLPCFQTRGDSEQANGTSSNLRSHFTFFDKLAASDFRSGADDSPWFYNRPTVNFCVDRYPTADFAVWVDVPQRTNFAAIFKYKIESR
jgi:hypothetical protein